MRKRSRRHRIQDENMGGKTEGEVERSVEKERDTI